MHVLQAVPFGQAAGRKADLHLLRVEGRLVPWPVTYDEGSLMMEMVRLMMVHDGSYLVNISSILSRHV